MGFFPPDRVFRPRSPLYISNWKCESREIGNAADAAGDSYYCSVLYFQTHLYFRRVKVHCSSSLLYISENPVCEVSEFQMRFVEGLPAGKPFKGAPNVFGLVLSDFFSRKRLGHHRSNDQTEPACWIPSRLITETFNDFFVNRIVGIGIKNCAIRQCRASVSSEVSLHR